MLKFIILVFLDKFTIRILPGTFWHLNKIWTWYEFKRITNEILVEKVYFLLLPKNPAQRSLGATVYGLSDEDSLTAACVWFEGTQR